MRFIYIPIMIIICLAIGFLTYNLGLEKGKNNIKENYNLQYKLSLLTYIYDILEEQPNNIRLWHLSGTLLSQLKTPKEPTPEEARILNDINELAEKISADTRKAIQTDMDRKSSLLTATAATRELTDKSSYDFPLKLLEAQNKTNAAFDKFTSIPEAKNIATLENLREEIANEFKSIKSINIPNERLFDADITTTPPEIIKQILASCPNLSYLILQRDDLNNMRLLDHTPYNLRWLIINIQTTILNTNLIGNKRLLHSLSIDHAKVDDLDFLAKLNDIENLKLTDMDLRYIDTSPLLTLHGLKRLILSKSKIADLSDILGNMPELKELRLPLNIYENIDDSLAQALPDGITNLSISENPEIRDLSFLGKLNNTLKLSIRKCDSLSDITNIKNMPKLEYLDLTLCKSVADISPIIELENLTKLDLSSCNGITDFTPLWKTVKLEHLVLPPGITDKALSAILDYQSNLKVIELLGCENLTSLNPLINHKKLRLVSIFSCYGITKQEITTLKKARPNIYIDTEESNDNENNTENENQKKNALKQHEMF